ncbi:chemotaxis protein CheB [Magnetococcales bacterium HHB-1]
MSSLKRILIANDSATDRALLRAIIRQDPSCEVVAETVDGRDTVAQALNLRPDLILMDLLMPQMNGAEATKQIMSRAPTRILIVTALVERNAQLIFTALSSGALDYTETPALRARPTGLISEQEVFHAGIALRKKIYRLSLFSHKSLQGLVHDLGETKQRAPLPPPRHTPPKAPKQSRKILAIGCSTGGPNSLTILLSAIPKPLSVPIIICQHIDMEFTHGMGEWLATETGLPVNVVNRTLPPQPGMLYLALGGRNISVSPAGYLTSEAPQAKQFFIPNIDHLFENIAQVFGNQACGVILTGMGNDGARGIQTIQAAGGTVFVQCPEDAIVPSMPEAALQSCSLKTGYNLEVLGMRIGQWMHHTAQRRWR